MPTSWLLALSAILLAVAYGLIVWQRRWVYRTGEFLGEVKAELRKVSWPPRKEVLGTTSVVIVAVFFFGIFLSVIDLLVTLARNGIYAAAGRLVG